MPPLPSAGAGDAGDLATSSSPDPPSFPLRASASFARDEDESELALPRARAFDGAADAPPSDAPPRFGALLLQLLQHRGLAHVVRHLAAGDGLGEVVQLQVRVHVLDVAELLEIVLVAIDVILHEVLQVGDVLGLQRLVVHQAEHQLHALDVLVVAGHGLLEVPEPGRPARGFVLGLFRRGVEGLDLGFKRLDLRLQLVHRVVQPLPRLVPRLFLRVLPLPRRLQPLLGERLRLRLLLDDLERLHLPLDQLARLEQRRLVTDVVAARPLLDLIAVALELLDLLLEVALGRDGEGTGGRGWSAGGRGAGRAGGGGGDETKCPLARVFFWARDRRGAGRTRVGRPRGAGRRVDSPRGAGYRVQAGSIARRDGAAPRAAGARFQGEAPGGLPHLILLLVALALGVDHLLVDAVVDVQALVDLLEGAVNLRLELPLVAHGASVGASLARAPPPSDASWRANLTRHGTAVGESGRDGFDTVS